MTNDADSGRELEPRFLGLELLVYSGLVVAYLYLVITLMADWIEGVHRERSWLFATISVGLIVGQAVLLDAITSLLFRLVRAVLR